MGATTAQRLAEAGWLTEVVLVDIVEGLAAGKALDIWESAPVMGFDTRVTGTTDYEETSGSNIVVITAGLARRLGMSRDDLLQKNAEIVGQVVREVAARSAEAILMMVTNPLDIMAYLAYKLSGWPRERVVGMAGILDTARFRSFVALELRVSVTEVSAFVLGGHGDSMVPLPRYSAVAGRPLPEILGSGTLERLIKRTRAGGAEIVNLLKEGSAYYAPSAAIYQMVEAIALDRQRILPCSALLRGEYGYEDLFLGVPVRLGRRGVEEVVEFLLTDEERRALGRSAEAVREEIGKLKL